MSFLRALCCCHKSGYNQIPEFEENFEVNFQIDGFFNTQEIVQGERITSCGNSDLYHATKKGTQIALLVFNEKAKDNPEILKIKNGFPLGLELQKEISCLSIVKVISFIANDKLKSIPGKDSLFGEYETLQSRVKEGFLQAVIFEDLTGMLPLPKNHPTNLKQVKKIARALFKALEVLKEHKIIHTSISPDSILVNGNFSHTKLHGFTNARKQLHKDKSVDINLFSAPELFLKKDPTYNSDTFSAALVCYSLCTNELPYQRFNVEKFINKWQFNYSKPLSDYQEGKWKIQPKENFQQFLTKTLHILPEKRVDVEEKDIPFIKKK